jgi:hypothetical protein
MAFAPSGEELRKERKEREVDSARLGERQTEAANLS